MVVLIVWLCFVPFNCILFVMSVGLLVCYVLCGGFWRLWGLVGYSGCCADWCGDLLCCFRLLVSVWLV